MAYLLNATKTPTACPAPIYGQNTPHFSHTVIIIIFFCLATSTSHRQARSCSLSYSMYVSYVYIDCTPFKTKENYTADYQFKCNTVQELVLDNLQRSQKLPGYRHIELFWDHKNGCRSRDTNIGCHDILIIKIARTLLRPLLLPNMYANTWAIIKYVLCFCTK